MKDEGRAGAIAPVHPSSFRLHPYETMQLQTFKAPTMAECLTQVKSAMGADAIILHTRTYQTKLWMGLRRQEVVEITAGKGMNIGRRPRPGQQADAGGKDPRPNPTVAGTYSRSGAARSAAAGGNGNVAGGGTAVAEPPGRRRPMFIPLPAVISTISRRRSPIHARVENVRVCRMMASDPIAPFTCVSASAIVAALNV